MSCAVSTLKFLTFILNILLCIFGALMISASAYVLVSFSGSDTVRVPCIIGVALGSVLFLTTILGFCGVIRESVRLTWIYSLCLVLLAGAQLLVIYLIPVDFKQLADETVTSAWRDQLYEDKPMTEYEVKYKCCGVNGPADYYQSGLMVPPSCYSNQNATISAADLLSSGCASRLAIEFEESARVELISNWVLVGIEAMTILGSSLLAVSLQNTKRRNRFH